MRASRTEGCVKKGSEAVQQLAVTHPNSEETLQVRSVYSVGITNALISPHP